MSSNDAAARPNELQLKCTGKNLDEIEKAMDRDKFLEADEAKAFGIFVRAETTRGACAFDNR